MRAQDFGSVHALLSRFFWVVFPYQSLLISLIQEVLMALEHNAYLGRDDLGKLLRSFSLPWQRLR